MSNTKGNQYPFWYISNEYQVFAVDSSQQAHQMSDVNFAMDISISEDGTVWILSTTPDPDGGGASIFWSNGDNNWNEIATSDPGGMTLTGATGSSCMFITATGEVYTLDTDGTASERFSANLGILEVSYGGGYLWALMPEKPGGIPVLRFMKGTDSTNTWKTFGNGVRPFSISVGYEGNCYGIDNFNPMYYSNNGSDSGSSGAGANGIALSITFKNWNFLLSTQANEKGNLIYSWVDEAGGTYEQTSLRANKVAATYY